MYNFMKRSIRDQQKRREEAFGMGELQMFFTIEKFQKRVEELERRRYFGLQSIESFTAMPGELPADGHYCGAPEKVVGEPFGRNDGLIKNPFSCTISSLILSATSSSILA